MHINADGHTTIGILSTLGIDNKVRLGMVWTKMNGQRGRMTSSLSIFYLWTSRTNLYKLALYSVAGLFSCLTYYVMCLCLPLSVLRLHTVVQDIESEQNHFMVRIMTANNDKNYEIAEVQH